jgi:hypothetical protein
VLSRFEPMEISQQRYLDYFAETSRAPINDIQMLIFFRRSPSNETNYNFRVLRSSR